MSSTYRPGYKWGEYLTSGLIALRRTDIQHKVLSMPDYKVCSYGQRILAKNVTIHQSYYPMGHYINRCLEIDRRGGAYCFIKWFRYDFVVYKY